MSRGFFLKRVFILSIALAVSSLRAPSPVPGGEFYKWTDKDGIVHYSDSTVDIPSEYLDRVKASTFNSSEPESGQAEAGPKTPFDDTAPGKRSETQGQRRYEVSYRAYEGGARRIIITVVFNGSVSAPMLLDTGAPGAMISYRLAEKLGLLDRDKGKLLVSTRGIGGSVPAIRTIIDTVQVGDAGYHFIPALITDSVSSAFEGLIGMDFMSNYSVVIDPRRKVLILQEISRETSLPGGHDEDWWRALFREFASVRGEWKRYSESLSRQAKPSISSLSDESDKQLKDFADRQYQAASQLFDKLNRYAAENAVPMSWRTY